MRAKLPNQEGFVDRDGVRVHYEVYGEGPDTILFIPPWAITHSHVYKAQIPWLSDHYRCISYDPRGNGQSDRPDRVDAYAVQHYVDDALAVLDATQSRAAILVGQSSGGALAAIVAAHYPERARAAVLLSTAATIGPGYPYLSPDHFEAKRDSFEGWDKFNRDYWLRDYEDFVRFFVAECNSEPHSSRQLEDGVAWALQTDAQTLVRTVAARTIRPPFDVSEQMYRGIRCPLLLMHSVDDRIQPLERARHVARVTGAELVEFDAGGHALFGRYPARVNALIVDFLERRLGKPAPVRAAAAANSPSRTRRAPKALYLSSPIGLGHGRRDIAIAQELRKLRPGLAIDWLAQDPVTRLLAAQGERVHPISARLASESGHFEEASGEHDLHVFEAFRRMDEILVANFMRFQEAVQQGDYDLVIADEAWDVDHFWHEHPELKRTALVWFTDFVGNLPMPDDEADEVRLCADYNAEMIEHVERHPRLRDRAIFVGNPEDIVDLSFGHDLPRMREWIPKRFEFSGYILGRHPATFGARETLRAQLGYRPDERVCIVTVGGSGVGAPLIRRILRSVPTVQALLPELRVVVVAGPRIDPASVQAPRGVEVRAFVPDLDRHLAACDLAVVQGGLTTCMELTAAGTPFLYFPLRNHFEQCFHVAHRLEQYGAGRRMDYATATPDVIATAMLEALRTPAHYRPVESDGAARAARMIGELL
jgi:pimeloyl-ACP methyl ester carboxylesterase/predicted glycosyltransferase